MCPTRRTVIATLAGGLAAGTGTVAAAAEERGNSGTHTENGVVVKFEACDRVKLRGNPDIAQVQIFGEQDFGGVVGWIGLNQSFDVDPPTVVEPLTDNPAYIDRIRVLDEDLNELLDARRSDDGESCREEVTD